MRPPPKTEGVGMASSKTSAKHKSSSHNANIKPAPKCKAEANFESSQAKKTNAPNSSNAKSAYERSVHNISFESNSSIMSGVISDGVGPEQSLQREACPTQVRSARVNLAGHEYTDALPQDTRTVNIKSTSDKILARVNPLKLAKCFDNLCGKIDNI